MGEEEKLDDSIHDARLFDNPDSRPIYLLATDCRNLFSKIGKQLEKGHHLEEFNLVSDSHDRFEAWAAFLAVFGSSVSSLDYRLRKHPSVQDSVMRLLDILRDKLLIDYDAVPDSIKTWAPNQISGSPNINELLIRLNRLGLWIRSLSRPGSKKKRVRAIAESQNLDLQGFQYLSCLSIETIYPNCPETLREQLASSMTDRFAQLWYESFRVGTLSKSTSATSTNDNPESSFYTKEDKSLAAKETPPENEKNTRPHVAFIIPATTIPVDQQQEHWGSESKLLQQSYPTQTETALDPYPAEPPIPTFEEGKDYAKCEWCFAMLEDTMFRKKNGRHTWSQKGRKHYRYDLRPYICISEGCFESFTSKGSWAEHMTSEHSEDWPQRIHNEPVWVCDLKHDQATLYMFATRVELENHVHLHHQMDESAAFHTSLSRPSASCPLCLFAVADQSDDSGPARDDTTFHEVSELRRHPLSNTVNHIARHMEFITVLTLRLVSNTLQSDGRESDSRSVFSTTSNLNSSDVARHGHGLAEDFGIEENDPTLTYLETPVPSLPGSSDWNGIGTAHLNGVAIGDTKVIDRMRQWNERNTLHDGPIILPWVKTIDYHSYQRKLSSERQPGTGQWFIDSEEFHRWSDSEDQTLFCSGERGAGKTILTSLVIDELQSCFNTNETISITYLFLNPEMQQEKSPEILCISLLQQLLNQRKSSPSNIKSIYDRYEIDKVRPPLEDILKGLELAALLFSRVYIVVDALDEVPTEYREKFLSSVFHLQKECSPLLQKVKFFATYRFDMSPTRLFQQALTLRIEAKPEDVSKYVYGNLHHFSTFIKHDGQLPEAMTSAIMQFTKGIFSRASFFLNSLTHKKSASEIRDALVLLRTDLDYEYAMHLILGESMELREHALRVLSWLTCAHRQLTAIEVQHIITTRIGKSELDKSRILGTGPIISACHGLVIVDEDDMIRFADDAAKTYFQKKRKEWFPEAEYDISGICATYLSLNVFNDGICQTDDEFEERLRSHALYEYAAQNWGHHCREATTINNAVTQFLTKKAHVEAASQLLMATDTKGSPGYSQRVPRNITGLHLAAYFGIEEVVLQLLSQISPSIEDSYNRTPLWNGQATIHVLQS
ncbi:hypothetical protein F5B19DRAFT_182353 [Rostrohypoxylon terebratum]|nr:hypothetical protein F5B19DRAFT_182353 [Rostrohypoxylon terebratum]